MPDTETLVTHEPDHIIAVQHGGDTSLSNLAYTCHQCNRYKGPNLASIDPDTGDRAFCFSHIATSGQLTFAGKVRASWG